MNTALIIDDNSKARDFLKRDLQSFCPQLKVVGEADGVLSGLKAIKKHRPDIVFLDIHMEDGTGFDVLELCGEIPFKVIFTTASDAHAIQAFKFSAIDYLLKPIDIEELIAAVQKATAAPALPAENVDLLKEHLQAEGTPAKRMALHTADKIHICLTSDIIRCEADVNYTLFCMKDGQEILVTKTLKHFDQLLSPLGFCRVHQSHLINLQEVKEFVKTEGGYLVMSNRDRVPVSNRKRAEVMELITRIH